MLEAIESGKEHSPVEYVQFGKTGIRVSRACLGTMTFGKEADEATSVAIMDRAAEIGINFFDTANIYVQGKSEEIVGRWLKPHRESFVLATKVHGFTSDNTNDRGSSRRNIILATEKCLKRLQTDWIDLLYLHLWDDNTPLEESLCALDTLVQQGKVMYVGISNCSAWQTMKGIAIAEAKGLAPIACTQPMYCLVKRQVEVEILPLAKAEGLAVCPYNPLGAGLLTGKYLRGESGRLQESKMYEDRFKNPHYHEIAARFVEYARGKGLSPAALAVAWVASHPQVTCPILGARTMEQFNDTLGFLDIEMTPEWRAEISALSVEPALATDR